jgi:hypothetical protein
VATAARLGYTALAVTDHDGFRGAVKVHHAARTIGLPVVYGTEVGLSVLPLEVEVPGGSAEPGVLPLEGEVPGGFAEGGGGFLRSAPHGGRPGHDAGCGPRVGDPLRPRPKAGEATSPSGEETDWPIRSHPARTARAMKCCSESKYRGSGTMIGCD